MNNKGALIRFCSAVVCTVLFLTYTTVKGLTDNDAALITAKENLSTFSKSDSADQIITYSSITVENVSDKQSTESNESIAVSSGGTVQGKIVDKFISPYTANTSYNNVYLKNNTDLEIDLKELLGADLSFKIEKNDEPQVLIIHTHATESYMLEDKEYYTDLDLSRTTDNEYNMVALGKIISDRLNSAGIKTIHDTTAHDYPSYNESYSRAADTICSYTEKYSSIKIVIDLHRDAIASSDTDKVKVTTEINGKSAAQIMLVMGSQSGSVKNFPNWKENLKLAVKLQQTVEVMYPTLARSIHFMPKNYNESLTNGSLLIEIGTDGNTLEEAKYSAELLSDALINLLNTL